LPQSPQHRSEGASSRVLVFSRTTAYRHASIEAGVAAVRERCADAGIEVEATEDAAVFRDDHLDDFGATLWLSTSGDVLDDDGRAALRRFVVAGGGYVGVHGASDTEYGWDWYGQLVGTWFEQHPEIQAASVEVVDQDHPATAHLPAVWPRVDEWYDFVRPPRRDARVLVRVDESSYVGGQMGADHPLAWCHEHEGGRSFYTAMGHTEDSYAEAPFLDHVLGGIRWALRQA
jgi:type 1 glutamine amidotransferase